MADADPGVAAAREDRRRSKVFNERLRLVVNFAHAVALAVSVSACCASRSTLGRHRWGSDGWP